MSEQPPANPPNPPADPPTVPDPPNPPSNPPSDHVTRAEFTQFSESITAAVTGLTEAVTKLVDASPARDQTAVGLPWTHRGSRPRDGSVT